MAGETEDFTEQDFLDIYKGEKFDLDSFLKKTNEAGYANEFELVDATKDMENLLGVGSNGSVYKIPSLSGFVLKVHTRGWAADEGLSQIEALTDPFPSLNFGQAVAKLGEGHLILKEQSGIPAGVPYGEIRSKSGEIGKLVYEEYLSLAAEMPQQAYDNLARLFLFLNEHHFAFDPSKSNNILLDIENGKFNVVDIRRLGDDQLPNNNFSYMVVALMDNPYAWRVDDKRIEDRLTQFRKVILEKAYEACSKLNLPVPRTDDSSLEYSFKLAGLEKKWPIYREQLKRTK